ncbi:putative glycosyl transferase [Calothrix sp. NIES-2100]|uniref:glycosyltransferase family 2 protein n=1 Tax=Calothrix sp. NIES-2100 TaxID=1954172 RepID=UPI000B5FE32C|nr:putative glycosyl transferase [Calothrix sp. NIES-2100]
MVITKEIANFQEVPMLNDNPLVSIIIGNYNYDRFVAQAIDSALNQTYQNIEVIVVDDGSTDKSREIIDQYGERIITIFKDNGGQHSNYNAGFAKSRGEIICFLDSDDIFLKDKVEKVVNIFKSSAEIGWCFHNIQLIDEKNNNLLGTNTPNYVTRECDFRTLINLGKIPPHIPPCSGLCFKRTVLEKILPMPSPKIVSSSDHYVKFMAVALSKGFMLDDKLTLQKIHGSNAATLRKDKQYQRARKYIYTAIWVKQEFPNLRKFANTMLAVGKMFNWKAGNNDSENLKVIENYLASISLSEKLHIYLRATYYYLHSLILAG